MLLLDGCIARDNLFCSMASGLREGGGGLQHEGVYKSALQWGGRGVGVECMAVQGVGGGGVVHCMAVQGRGGAACPCMTSS